MSMKAASGNRKSGPSRRMVIAAGLAAPWLITAPAAFAQAAAAGTLDKDGFQKLSLLVIGKAAGDRLLSDSLFDAYSAVLPAFLQQAASLADAAAKAGLQTPADLSRSALLQDAGLKATALSLTTAWYLGHVGDDAKAGKVVAFEKALMFGPTSDVMVIPSYTRGGPDYWAPKQT